MIRFKGKLFSLQPHYCLIIICTVAFFEISQKLQYSVMSFWYISTSYLSICLFSISPPSLFQASALSKSISSRLNVLKIFYINVWIVLSDLIIWLYSAMIIHTVVQSRRKNLFRQKDSLYNLSINSDKNYPYNNVWMAVCFYWFVWIGG